MAFKFIHAADLHLGCRQYNLDERYNDFFEAFEKVARIAITRRVDALLLAGDVFHHRSIEASTLLRATQILQKTAEQGIITVVTEGNHDRAWINEKQSWLQYLSSIGLIKLLMPQIDENGVVLPRFDGNSGSVLELPDVRIIGLGFLGGQTETRLAQVNELIPESTKPTLILLHAGIDKMLHTDIACAHKEAVLPLKRKAVYLALGHIHNANYVIEDFAYNPGAIENVTPGRFDEEKRGVFYCEIGQKPEFISVGARKVVMLKCDGGKRADDIIEDLKAACPDGAGALAQVELYDCQGAVDIETINSYMLSAGFLHANFNCKMALDSSFVNPFLSTEELERQVIDALIAQKNAKQQAITSDLIISLKRNLLMGETPENIFNLLQGTVRQP